MPYLSKVERVHPFRRVRCCRVGISNVMYLDSELMVKLSSEKNHDNFLNHVSDDHCRKVISLAYWLFCLIRFHSCNGHQNFIFSLVFIVHVVFF
jgi:hypothetical protein